MSLLPHENYFSLASYHCQETGAYFGVISVRSYRSNQPLLTSGADRHIISRPRFGSCHHQSHSSLPLNASQPSHTMKGSKPSAATGSAHEICQTARTSTPTKVISAR